MRSYGLTPREIEQLPEAEKKIVHEWQRRFEQAVEELREEIEM